jgi:UDP-3-O-[3-hydroxymyristoyl] glucosamine N-acyltransferase
VSETLASAILVREPRDGLAVAQLVHPNPYLAYLKAVHLFRGEPVRPRPGVHPSAVVDPNARVAPDAAVGPHVVVEAGASIGPGAVLMAGVYVGHRTRIGAGSVLHPNVVVREECEIGERVILHPGVVIGADGFGYVREGRTYHKVPQVGIVILEDDVEIGANSCVDRATTGVTRVGAGTKIDNLVQIGHNVEMGPNVIVVAQVGISGSVQVGAGATLAGQAGVAGHIRIGDNAVVGGQSGVAKSVPDGGEVWGTPALPGGVARRVAAIIHKLPQLVTRVQALERRLAEREGEPKPVETHTRR